MKTAEKHVLGACSPIGSAERTWLILGGIKWGIPIHIVTKFHHNPFRIEGAIIDTHTNSTKIRVVGPSFLCSFTGVLLALLFL